MQTINIIVHTEDASQIEAIKALLKAFKIKFEILKEDDNIEKCLLSDEQKKSIDEALKSIEAKGTTPHNIVMDETKKRFPHLYNR
jgi:CRISPR/Cas system Type II protein with McrA/HNH and RuvC-like nuclease domain